MKNNNGKKTDEGMKAENNIVEPSLDSKLEITAKAETEAEKQGVEKEEVQKKQTEKEEKSDKKLSAKLEKIAKEIEELNVLELSQLASYLEEIFGVSAMPVSQSVVQPVAPVQQAGQTASSAEEKTKFTVVLTDAGANKLGVIKAVREFRQDLGLMDAKKIVEEAPKDILVDVKKEEAEAALKKLVEAGAKAEIK